jgi:hypothetical protein
MLSSGLFPGICSLNVSVSELSVCSIFIGEYLLAYEDEAECWHLNYRRREITQKKAYEIMWFRWKLTFQQLVKQFSAFITI